MMTTTHSETVTHKGAGRIPYVSLLLGAAALMIHALPGAEKLALKINDPTWFTTLTSHFVHWNDQHLLWSGGAFVTLAAVCELRARINMLFLIATSIACISIGLLILPGEITFYGGLSGIDSALFALVVARLHTDLRHHKNQFLKNVPRLCALGFLAKLTYEFTTGQAYFVQSASAMSVVPVAHIIGFAVGVIFGVGEFYIDRYTQYDDLLSIND